jgi:hypothetical protein
MSGAHWRSGNDTSPRRQSSCWRRGLVWRSSFAGNEPLDPKKAKSARHCPMKNNAAVPAAASSVSSQHPMSAA